MNCFMLQAQTPNEPAVWFVCVLGIGVVFVGLAALVGLVSLMNVISSKFPDTSKKKKTDSARKKSDVIENKQEIIAAVCAAVAEETGTDISALRVLSFKKL